MPQKHRARNLSAATSTGSASAQAALGVLAVDASEDTHVALCPLFGRELVAGPSVDVHHLIPRSQGGKQKYVIHRVCHQKIHATYTEQELALVFNKWASLQAADDMQGFLRWVRKKPATFVDRTKKTNRLRKR
jgi:5-methylcytosine-specific restriction endonuclease McrA